MGSKKIVIDVAKASPEVEAVAESWASMDGRGEDFYQGKFFPNSDRARQGGHYEGYIADAEELLARVRVRGFVLVPKGSEEP